MSNNLKQRECCHGALIEWACIRCNVLVLLLESYGKSEANQGLYYGNRQKYF